MRFEDFPVVGGLGFELVKNSARRQIILKIKKSFGQRRCGRGNDVEDFHALPGEKVWAKHVRRADQNFPDSGLPVISALDFANADAGDAAPFFLGIALDNFQARRFGERAVNGDNRRFMAQQGAEIVRRNDGRVRGKIGPADEREQRPDQKWPKFFADENEDEEEKRSDKQRGERRLKELCEQQAGGVGKDDGDKRTVHVPPGLRIFQRSHNSSKATAPPQVSISTSETCAVREGTKA